MEGRAFLLAFAIPRSGASTNERFRHEIPAFAGTLCAQRLFTPLLAVGFEVQNAVFAFR